MCDIKLKVEGPGTCHGCLSSNRKLASVRQLSSCDLYYSLLTEKQKLEALSVPHIAFCWECIALLRRTQRFREQVQKAHTILQISSQLLSVEPTLSSLTFHQKLKYDAVLEENEPYEIPLFHKTQEASTDKVIIPTKYNSTATKSNVDNVKNIKDVINDLLSKVKIEKVEQPSNDSEDNILFEGNDNNFNSPEEISDNENNSKILQKVTQPKQDSKPLTKKLSKQIENAHSSGDSEDKPKRKRQKKSELDLDLNLEDKDNYASNDSENFKPFRIKMASKPLTKKLSKQIEKAHSSGDSEDKPKRKRQKKSELDLDLNLEDKDHYASNDSENFKPIRIKMASKPLTKKLSKQIEKAHSSGDSEDKPKRKRQKKSELDLDLNLEDKDNYASNDSENFKPIRIKMASKPLTKKLSKQIEKAHSSGDSEDKPKRKRQKKSELDLDLNLEDKDNYASNDSENFKPIRIKMASKPLTKKLSKQIEKAHSSGDSEDKPKRKRQKKSELDLDLNLEDKDNYASNDSENFKPIRIKMAKEQSNTDPNLTVEGDNTRNTRKKQHTFRKTITQYKDIEDLTPYFTEIEMSEQDIKITLEKDDATVDERLKKKPMKCKICGLMFRQRQTLMSHTVRLHKAQYPNQMQKGSWINPPPVFPHKSVWQCNVCARMMRREHIVAHMNEYHRTQYFCIGDGCEWCERPFWSKQDLDQHWEEIHKQFLCDYCSIYKKTKMRLEKHIQVSHTIRVKYVTNQYQCKLCMRVLSSIKSLKVHHARIHEKNKEPIEQRYCMDCNLTFTRMTGYVKHFREKHLDSPKPSGYPCETCGRVLANKVSLKNHVNIKHKGKTPYCCHICGKYLSKPQSLRQHLDSHNNVKTPKTKPCTVCGRMFQTNRILRNHMYTHTGERPYKCSRCDAAFRQSYCLRVHLAKQHQVDASVWVDGTIIEGLKTYS